MAKILEGKKISKIFVNGDFKNEVLKNLDINVNAGEVTVLLGTSGSGKTTLLNAISGLDKATSGAIIINGVDIQKLNEKELTKFRRENISFIFQQYNLIKDLTVYENVKLSAELVGNENLIESTLEQVGLEKYLNAYPHQLSGGMQQRVAIARALVKQPKIMFCDEPTGALDEKSGRDVLELIKEVNEKGTTVFMITHNPNIANMAHQVIHIKNGLIDSVKHNEVLQDPRDIEWG